MYKTITAIATAPGEGASLSSVFQGHKPWKLQIKFSPALSTPTLLTQRTFLDLDEGLLLVMRAPNSYTGEDTVELNCHGGSLMAQAVHPQTSKQDSEQRELLLPP